MVGETLYVPDGDIIIVNVQNPSPSDLSPFLQDIVPPDDVRFCPGTVPTQFEAGDWAKITVDQRGFPLAQFFVGNFELDKGSGLGSTRQIVPLGSYVEILESPGCSPYGWSYVRIRYHNTIGWLLEIYGTNYYLAPLD